MLVLHRDTTSRVYFILLLEDEEHLDVKTQIKIALYIISIDGYDGENDGINRIVTYLYKGINSNTGISLLRDDDFCWEVVVQNSELNDQFPP